MTVIPFKKPAGKKCTMPTPPFKAEVNKQVAFDDLMEKVMELVDVCGGWDEKADDFKPGVSAQIERVARAAREGLELTTSH